MKKLITVAVSAAMCAALAAAPAFAHGGHHNGGHGPHHQAASAGDCVKITKLTDAVVENPSSDSEIQPAEGSVPAVRLRPARGQGCDSQNCDFMTDEEKAKCEEICAQLNELKAQYAAAETDEEKAAVLAEMKELAKAMPRMRPAMGGMGHKGHHPHNGGCMLDSEGSAKLAELKEALKSAETEEEKQEIIAEIQAVFSKAGAGFCHKHPWLCRENAPMKSGKAASSADTQDVQIENEPLTPDTEVIDPLDPGFEVIFDYDFDEII